jgi:hypothetical protein
MKTLLLFIIAVAFAVTAQAQTSVRMKSEPIGFWTIGIDTMQVLKTDGVIKLSGYVPESATDSTIISGCTFTIDGIPTNGIKIAPGEAAVNIGFDYAPLDSVRIESRNKTWLMMLIDRN